MSVNLVANRSAIQPGEPVSLTWRSKNASACRASGAWNGMVSTSGSRVVSGITSTSSFNLSCSGLTGAGAASSVQVRVTTNAAVKIEFAATPSAVRTNAASTLTWRAINASGCVSSGDWSGKRALDGRFETGPLKKSVSYTLLCSNNTAQAMATVTIAVGSGNSRIEWAAPTLNVDGTKAHDIAGYRVYWGSKPSALRNYVELAPATRTWWEPNLPRGDYYFAVSAFDSLRQEGELSLPFRKTIP